MVRYMNWYLDVGLLLRTLSAEHRGKGGHSCALTEL